MTAVSSACGSRLSGSRAGAIILLYHRIAEPKLDPQALCVRPEHFAEHLDVIRRRFRPLSLAELADQLAAGGPAPGAVVVTFDDGYADNLYCALPLLMEYGVPAAVFVATKHLPGGGVFWWDELAALVFEAPQGAQINLTCIDAPGEWIMSDDGSDGTVATDSSWNVLRPAVTARQAAYIALCGALRLLPDAQRDAVLDDVARQVGAGPSRRALGRSLSAAELLDLAASPLIEVGAHTVTHPVLSALAPEAQADEIARGKADLEAIIGRPVRSFAYPFGTRRDYNDRAVNLVAVAGFAVACANFEGIVDVDADRRQLPRFIVRDWDGDAFAERLHSWAGVRA